MRGVAQWAEIPPQPNRSGNDFIRFRSAMECRVYGTETERRKRGPAEAETVQKKKKKINIEGDPRPGEGKKKWSE